LEYKTSSFGSNSDATGRTNYYGIGSVPTAKFDGRRTVSGGSSGTFSSYLSAYNMEMQFYRSSCLLSIFVDYDSTTRFLKVKSKVTAVESFSGTRIRYAIAENDIPYTWGGGGAPTLYTVEHVVRKMLPSYIGVAMPPMDPNDTFIDSQTYTLSSTWKQENCYVVVFVQDDDDATHPVFRSAKSGLFETWTYGDASGDGTVDVADVIHLSNYLFQEGSAPDPMAAGDANDDCIVDIADVIYLINYLFLEGAEPGRGCAF
jgi:hypothetical protein